ncbi:DUF4190 domain-containing protein [Nocardioides albus]|uniref:DUF4190 domain-containing protein n=1 Tax=Nocardioides albus TaxID=1841 RepID=A0A7W5A134_9ACTN|nr:DUF4190 domain-containing protein [Nocardioides albus]MBB3087718.1 hypothetical protein [Nocardioides albus]GGU10957.1 hypothetical protein GCM10007979_06420 [Nocardioides albus]
MTSTPPPGYQPAPYGFPQPPPHPEASSAMVFGIVGLCLSVMCGGIGVFIAPFGWIKGKRVMAEIDANPAAYGGRSNAQAGFITGIIGTVFGALMMLFWIAYVVFIIVMLFVVAEVEPTTTYDSVNAMLSSRI